MNWCTAKYSPNMFTRMPLSQICDTGHNGVDSVSSDAREVTACLAESGCSFYPRVHDLRHPCTVRLYHLQPVSVLIRDFLFLNSTSPLHVFMAIVEVFYQAKNTCVE